jgi:GntR family transcriptional repressor for pyruvate dehydrogenase complex
MNDRTARTGFPPVRPVATSRLADEVVEQIRTIILENDLQEGTRLPSERELSQRLGASRPIVAQALRTLSMMGLVDIRPGSGAYVIRRPEHLVVQSMRLMRDVGNDAPEHLLELRLTLEDAGTRLAVERASRQDIDRIEAALGRIVDAATPSAWVPADAVFHSELVRAGGNAYLSLMFEAVHNVAVSSTYESWVESGSPPEWLLDAVARPDRLHLGMLEALRARDADAMRAAVVAHHETMYRHLLHG